MCTGSRMCMFTFWATHVGVESSFAAADSHLWILFAVLAATTAIDFIIFGLGTVVAPVLSNTHRRTCLLIHLVLIS